MRFFRRRSLTRAEAAARFALGAVTYMLTSTYTPVFAGRSLGAGPRVSKWRQPWTESRTA